MNEGSKKWIILLIVLAAVAVFVISTGGSSPSEKEGEDKLALLNNAKEQGIPVFLNFFGQY
ncbi:MAG: hypothetical protein PHY90_12825 [Desulfitobacteriaceae bacterium]|mgnify:CR=1 FL=1|nr:hypothetical protein [Desulfitobacteriaceae bacterium]